MSPLSYTNNIILHLNFDYRCRRISYGLILFGTCMRRLVEKEQAKPTQTKMKEIESIGIFPFPLTRHGFIRHIPLSSPSCRRDASSCPPTLLAIDRFAVNEWHIPSVDECRIQARQQKWIAGSITITQQQQTRCDDERKGRRKLRGKLGIDRNWIVGVLTPPIARGLQRVQSIHPYSSDSLVCMCALVPSLSISS